MFRKQAQHTDDNVAKTVVRPIPGSPHSANDLAGESSANPVSASSTGIATSNGSCARKFNATIFFQQGPVRRQLRFRLSRTLVFSTIVVGTATNHLSEMIRRDAAKARAAASVYTEAR